MQDLSKKRRRNSIMVVEKNGEKDEILKNPDISERASDLKEKVKEKTKEEYGDLKKDTEELKSNVSDGVEKVKKKSGINKSDRDAEKEDFHSVEEDGGYEKAVDFDEAKNTVHSVAKNANKSIPEESERKKASALGKDHQEEEKFSFKDKNDGEFVHEGEAFKKRMILCCFWAKRHFMLSRDGTLKYQKSLTKSKCNFLNIKEVEVVSKVDRERQSHPYQIVITLCKKEKILAFDSIEERDSWASAISNLTRKIRGDE